MPRLPGPEDLGQRPVPRAPTNIAQYNPAMPGAEEVGQAQMRLGNTMQAVGEEIWREKEKIDATRVEDAWNQYKNAATDLTIGEKGVLKQRGGDAVNGNLLQTASTGLRQARQQIESSLASDEQRRRFAARADVTDLQVKHQVLAHIDTEEQHYAQTVQMGSEAAAKAQITAMPTSPDVFKGARDTLMAQADTYLDLRGIKDPGARAAYKDKMSDGLWQTRIDTLLETQPLLADSLFRANSKEIKSPEVRLVLQAKTREVAIGINATIEAQKAIDDVRSLPQRYDVKFDPKTKDKSIAAIEAQLAKEPNNEELLQAKYVIESHDEQPSTNGLPNAKDVAAQLPLVLLRVNKRADALYGPDPANPDRAAFVKRMTSEVHSKIASDVQQLNYIQSQALGQLANVVAGISPTGAPTEGGVMPVGSRGTSAAGIQKVSSFSEIQANPELLKKYLLLDYNGQRAIDNLITKNQNQKDTGDVVLYRQIFDDIQRDPSDPKKINFNQQITNYPGAERLSVDQIARLFHFAAGSETPGGRSFNQMRKSADAQVGLYFKTNIMFTAQPERQIAATMRWNEDAARKIDDYAKAGKDPRTLFMQDTPDSIVNQKYLQTYVDSTPAQGLADNAAKIKQKAVSEFLKPGETLTVLNPRTADEQWKALPAGAPFQDPQGNLRRKGGKQPQPANPAPAVPGGAGTRG